METQAVYCEVRTGLLNIIQVLMEGITMCYEYTKTLIDIRQHNYLIIRGYMFRSFKRSEDDRLKCRNM